MSRPSVSPQEGSHSRPESGRSRTTVWNIGASQKNSLKQKVIHPILERPFTARFCVQHDNGTLAATIRGEQAGGLFLIRGDRKPHQIDVPVSYRKCGE